MFPCTPVCQRSALKRTIVDSFHGWTRRISYTNNKTFCFFLELYCKYLCNAFAVCWNEQPVWCINATGLWVCDRATTTAIFGVEATGDGVGFTHSHGCVKCNKNVYAVLGAPQYPILTSSFSFKPFIAHEQHFTSISLAVNHFLITIFCL